MPLGVRSGGIATSVTVDPATFLAHRSALDLGNRSRAGV